MSAEERKLRVQGTSAGVTEGPRQRRYKKAKKVWRLAHEGEGGNAWLRLQQVVAAAKRRIQLPMVAWSASRNHISVIFTVVAVVWSYRPLQSVLFIIIRLHRPTDHATVPVSARGPKTPTPLLRSGSISAVNVSKKKDKKMKIKGRGGGQREGAFCTKQKLVCNSSSN